MNNPKIDSVRFSEDTIYVALNDGSEKSCSLEAFPILLNATENQRNDYSIWNDGHSIRWEDIDEDIHISSFVHDPTLVSEG